MMTNKNLSYSPSGGFYKAVGAAIIVAAVFAADIALARIVDFALDAMH